MKQKAYAAAGVDIDLGNKVKATLPQLLASTHRREVLGKVGGLGFLFHAAVSKAIWGAACESKCGGS